MPFYASQSWDPKLICTQICAVQSLTYLSYGFIFLIFHLMFGSTVSLGEFFDTSLVTFSTHVGFSIIVASVLNSVSVAVILFVVVERAKKCFDFAFTSHLIHFLICCFYDGFPSANWWILNLICLILSASLGEHLCARLELSEINVADFLNFGSKEATSIV